MRAMAATSQLSDRWRDPAFVDAAHAWIAARLAEHDRAVVGTIEQPHVTDWSTVMRVPTGDGPVWFKANDESMRHEAAVTALVAPLSAGRVPVPLAGDPRTGWLLMADAGPRLRDVVPEERSLQRWHDVLEACARIQLACEDEVDALLAAGLPDRRLTTLPEAYDALLTQLDDVDPRLPDAGAIADLCEQLAAFGIRETVQHDDLHDGQVFLGDGVHQVLDWGDACVSHPFFTLAVTLEGVVAWGVDDEEGSEDLEPYLASYLRPYAERYPLTDADLHEAARVAMRLGWVCRAINGALPQDPGQTHTRLRMFLDGRP
jgi:hypothetical protein